MANKENIDSDLNTGHTSTVAGGCVTKSCVCD